MSSRKEPKDQPDWQHSNPDTPAAAKGDPSAKKGSGFAGKATLAVAVVISLAIGFAAGRMTSTSKSAAASNPVAVVTSSTSPAVATSAAPTGTLTSSGSPSASASGSTAPLVNPSGIGTVNLTDLTPASTTFTNPDTNPLLNGKAQLLSISSYVGGNPDGGCVGTTGDAEYNIGRDYTKFTALIGVDDNSTDEQLNPSVEIDGDGLKLAVYTPTLGHPAQVSVNVTNVLRLDIKYTDAGAPCNINYLVVGGGELTTVPGYSPPTSSPTS